MYKHIIRPILFLFDPEAIHTLAIFVGEFCGRFSVTRKIVDLMYGYHGRDISKTVDGIYYKTPIILSAGFDYNGRLSCILPHVAFGGAEIGSVTYYPCEGNSPKRMARLINSKSILVNKGLRNDGSEKIIERLQHTKKDKDFVIGISLARTNDSTRVDTEEGMNDYVNSLHAFVLADIGDYYAINISCPNAFGGESFAEPKLLDMLCNRLDMIVRKKPLYIKMPISISDDLFLELLVVLDTHNVQGVIIGNLQKDYSHIHPDDKKPETFCGGLSGAPCRDRSVELISLTKSEYKNRFTIIGCGGIFSYQDAKAKIDAGADLIQLVTGMIYEGPNLMKSICKEIR